MRSAFRPRRGPPSPGSARFAGKRSSAGGQFWPSRRLERVDGRGAEHELAAVPHWWQAKPRAWLWTVITAELTVFRIDRVEGGEPTKQAAERASRPAVRWCKGRFGSDSVVGRRLAERLLAIVAS